MLETVEQAGTPPIWGVEKMGAGGSPPQEESRKPVLAGAERGFE